MADLKTNYVDDVLDTTKNQLRKYQQIQNDDGTVSFVDVTEYTQVGTSFGAKDINDTNAAINDVNGKLVDQSSGKSITLHLESLPCVNRNNVRATTFIPFPFYTINTKYNISFNNIVVSILSYGVLSGSVQIKTKYNNGISVDFNFTSSSNATDIALSGDITITF